MMKPILLHMRGLLLLAFMLPLAFMACEKDITVDLPDAEEKLVVEGHIETGQFPYVILTRNFSFFADEGGIPEMEELFVHDAEVFVTHNDQDYQLEEYCLSNLPPQLKPVIAEFLGINVDSIGNVDYCAYVNLNLTGEVGEQYDLTVRTDSDTLHSTTYLPAVPPIDSLWTEPDSEHGDSLVVLWCQFREPDTTGNYYRYFTKRNDEPFYPGYFGSVLDDEFANGQLFTFNLDRGYPRNADINFDTYGLFEKGDTVVVNISMIDKGHYRFWETTENQWRSGGPFASPTYIQSNVENGLGVWGGYSPTYDTIFIR